MCRECSAIGKQEVTIFEGVLIVKTLYEGILGDMINTGERETLKKTVVAYLRNCLCSHLEVSEGQQQITTLLKVVKEITTHPLVEEKAPFQNI
jgi:predicted glycosyltransferase